MNDAARAETRQLKPDDLERVVEIDRRITGRPRAAFFDKRLEAALADMRGFITTAIERDGALAAFAIARLQDGEFGEARRAATLDVIGVDPDRGGQGLGRALLGRVTEVMGKLDVHELRTQVGWHEAGLTRFFAANGFALEPRLVLERTARRGAWDRGGEDAESEADADLDGLEPHLDAGVPDYSAAGAERYEGAAPERLLVRSLKAGDLPAVIRIDRKLVGRERAAFFDAKLKEVLGESGIRVSQAAELDGHPVGFVMARVDYGEYGRTEPAAVIDALGVDPSFAHKGVGRALLSQLLMNLEGLHVETLRTAVRWNNFGLLGFLDRAGFVPSQQLLLSRPVA